MEEAHPASLALWEQFLVYGIALGVAKDVLPALRLHAPPEAFDESGLPSLGSGVDGGDIGAEAFSFEDIQDSFSRAFTPPSLGSYDSGSSGSGGSFSGGGGDGGGGAW